MLLKQQKKDISTTIRDLKITNTKEFVYRRHFFGRVNFIGEEVVYKKKGKPIWDEL